jgi:uncharacterized secreted protein with C-terminal beta-propeller domain
LPYPGDPSEETLAQVRLEGLACEDFESQERRLVETRVAEMHRQVKQSLVDWREEQPSCWEMYREQKQYWDEQSKFMRRRSSNGGSYSKAVKSMAPSISTPMRSELSAKPSPAGRVTSASGTNNQVQGVDEADIVKHDGKYIYFAVNGALRIASIEPPKVLSVTKVGPQVKELFVEGNRVTIYSALEGKQRKRCTYGYDCEFLGDGSKTNIQVYDVSNRLFPKLVRNIELSGALLAARRIGNAVHTIVSDGDNAQPDYVTWPKDLPRCSVYESVVKTRLAKLAIANEQMIRRESIMSRLPTLRDGDRTEVMCRNLYRTKHNDKKSYVSVVSFDMSREGGRPTTNTIQIRPGAVFMSENALYVTVTEPHRNRQAKAYSFYDQSEEVSEIHKFRVGSEPESTKYVGSGAVPGHVLNQFAMDDWGGYLRIATTSGRVPNPKVESSVSVLREFPDGNLVRVGAIEHIAPGEDIRSVRFEEDRGYVVTFKKTDPLFVLDLTRPDAPVVLGELKIPGFSTYMHRIDRNHLLSIGFDANDHTSFAYFDGVILQLFDVSNPTEPKLIHKEKIGTRGSSSEAITDHLAFNYFGERGLLGIPMTLCEGGGDGTYGNQLAFAGLLVYRVSVKGGFERVGGVNHGTAGSNCSTWWSNATSVVKRSLFLDDWVWSVTMDRAKVQKLDHLGVDEAEIALR